MKKSYLIVLAVAVIVIFYSWSAYNRFVTLSENVDGQWAQVETQYQRRFDLIPNLVESVKGIFNQEKEVFGKLADARSKYAGSRNVEDRVRAANEVETALSRLLVVVENYPQLRSSESVVTLMAQLEGAENRVSVERGRYNDSVRAFNTAAKRFPANLLAGLFGFEEKIYFESEEGSENAPAVKF